MFWDVYERLCFEKGVSPSKAAIDMGFSNASATDWKKRGGTPRRSSLLKMAEYFNVSIDVFLEIQEKTKKDPTQLTLSEVLKMTDKMQSALPNLTPEQIAEMFQLWIERGYIDNQSTSEQ